MLVKQEGKWSLTMLGTGNKIQSLKKFILGDLIGRGAEDELIMFAMPAWMGAPKPLMAKIISVRELASVVREALFYQHIFLASTIAQSRLSNGSPIQISKNFPTPKTAY